MKTVETLQKEAEAGISDLKTSVSGEPGCATHHETRSLIPLISPFKNP